MDPFGDLTRALTAAPALGEGPTRVDLAREERKGVPEVVLAETKADDVLLAAVRAFLDGRGRAIVSRVRPEQGALLRAAFAESELEEHGRGRTLVLRAPGWVGPPPGGRVAVITAGSSDVPVADEAAVVAREMGCQLWSAYDVGVAG